MDNKLILSGAMALQLLFGLAAGALEVQTLATTSAMPLLNSDSADIFYETRVTIINSDASVGGEPVTWFNDFAMEDCIFSESRDDSFCCIGDSGNEARLSSVVRNYGCPIGAQSSTFAFALGAFDDDISACISPCLEPGARSPILISIGDRRFELTDLMNGARFDLDQDGHRELISWTAPGVDDGFLALDRDGNGVIDHGGELFGDGTPQGSGGPRNGFLALAWFDDSLHGGDGDGFISAHDSVFSSLRVWFDWNHDGLSQASELRPLSDLGIAKVDLEYRENSRRDRYGNEFRFRGRVILEKGGEAPLWDVFFLRE